MKNRVEKKDPGNIPELIAAMKEAWISLDQNMIDDLIRGTPGRFDLCLTQEGGSIGHLLHRREPGPVPAGFLRPHDIDVINAGHVIRVTGIVVYASPLLGTALGSVPYFFIHIEDHPNHLRQKERARRVVLKVKGTDITEWFQRSWVTFIAVGQSGSQWDHWLNCQNQSGRHGPIRLYLEFQEFTNLPTQNVSNSIE
jgi:hypothetical protein